MELFTVAGVELPIGETKARRRRALARALSSPIFAHKVVVEAKTGGRVFTPTDTQIGAARDYARKVKDAAFLAHKETAVREMLVQDVLQVVLGYRPFDPGKPYDLARERTIRAGSVDVAIGRFNRPGGADEVVAPFELKGPGCADLDHVISGRGRSPVQQAWDYAVDSPGSRWVLVSNCLEIRLYAFGRGRDAFERFDLRKLDDRNEHHRLWLILAASNLLGEATDRLLRASDQAYRDVTAELYEQYKNLRERLIKFLRNGGEGPALPLLQSVEIAQKLLDRVLFIAFAQRTDLMADRLLERAAKERNSFSPQPLWNNFLGLFRAVDRGSPNLDIPPYNGGLFAADPVADKIILPDHLAEEIANLGSWDYRRQVPVTVLGRLFEQSITDIETLKSGAAPKVSRRKREGVVYTPEFVTRFLVEMTIAVSLDERREALWAEHGMNSEPSTERQTAFWRAYLTTLRDFTVVDPACGSGAFLVAAFEELARRYREALGGLEDLNEEIDFDVFDQILGRNLYGVDLNAESVEITRLALWLKTARRDHRLQNLEATIKDGDSLIADASVSARAFDWRAAFPEVFARGGFDVVIGNPPYVRMEHLKAIKPYLARNYIVADDRTDLYAYFFERGADVLKLGGRLRYISSSTFFRTGSGEKLRTFLGDGLALETVVDFGDLQLFEGVTTYPAIVTLRKAAAVEGELAFLKLERAIPDDLGRALSDAGQTMPRARLGRGSWRLEGDALARLRAKIADGRPTLGEVYGPPLYGIKTGLNEAFVIERPTRDALVARDPNSAELLKPFLRGEDVKRWRVESTDLFLINTPKGHVDIEAYPAIRDWLAPFRTRLEERATKQAWWELQQAQLAYQSSMSEYKISYPHFQNDRMFTLELTGAFSHDKTYLLPHSDLSLLAYLNSQAAWFFVTCISPAVRNGWHEMRVQYVERTPLPITVPSSAPALNRAASSASTAATERWGLQRALRRRILDLAPPERRRLTDRLRGWHALDFTAFRAEVKKAFGSDIPLKARAEWEDFLAENAARVNALTADIKVAERHIDEIVYGLFDLTAADIALLESCSRSR